MKLALNENTIPQVDLIRFINLAAKAGFTAIEPNIRKVQDALSCYSSKKIIKLLRDCSLSVLPINYFCPYFTPLDNKEFLKKQCEYISYLCESIVCSQILTPAGVWLSSIGKKPAWKDSLNLQKEILIFMAEVFLKNGISIAVEPVGRKDFSFTRLVEADELIHSTGLKNIGIVSDIHLQICGGDRPEDLEKIRAPMVLMHLNDTDNTAKRPFDIHYDRTFPGEGKAECIKWVSIAFSKGFSGYFSLELFSDTLASMPAEEAVYLCFRKVNQFVDSYHKTHNY